MDIQVILNAIPEIVTQLVAFILVFFILKKYAFGAVFQMLEERQKTIEGSIAEAKKSQEDMALLKKDYEAKLHGIEQEGRKKIQEAINDSQRIAAEIKDKATADAEKQIAKAKAEINQEITKAKEVIRREVIELSTQIAAKVIEKNISAAENEKFIEGILDKTGDLS
jgi:F-type H+-transporting ATPase subunit b